MPRRRLEVPSYRHHKKSNQAVVTVYDAAGNRRELPLGRYGSPESRAEYARVVAELSANGGRFPVPADRASDLTVAEMLLQFLRHAERHYRHPDGTATGTYDNFRLAVRPVRKLYGHTPAAEFGPLALKAVRQSMIDAGLCRTLVNGRVAKIRQMFRWAVSEELIPASIGNSLAAVDGLRRGRTAARESAPVRPVSSDHVDAVLPYLNPTVRAMVQVMRYTGCRPGEVCIMTAESIDTSGPVWTYRPGEHKTAHLGRTRVVCIGPKAQVVLRPFLTPDLTGYIFSPRRETDRRSAELRARRKTPVQPSQKNRRVLSRQRPPGERYRRLSLGQAVTRACRKAGVPPWHPNRLRHSHGTGVRKQFGLEAAQTTLGHSKANITEMYAERDLDLALRVAAELG